MPGSMQPVKQYGWPVVQCWPCLLALFYLTEQM